MKEIFKISLLLSIIVLSLSTIGCSDIDSQDENNPEINNKEKQEISLADILDIHEYNWQKTRQKIKNPTLNFTKCWISEV